MSEAKIVEVDNDIEFEFPKLDAATEDPLKTATEDPLKAAIIHIQHLIHNLRLAYDIKPDKRLSDIIVAQELSHRELISLINQ